MKYAVLQGGDRDALERSGLEYLNPSYTVKVYVRHIRKHKEVSRPLYPGYLFLREDCVARFFSEVRRGRILATDGVIHYVERSQINYLPPPEPPKIMPKVGDFVEVSHGPFEGVGGVVETLDENCLIISTTLGSMKIPVGLCSVKNPPI